MSSRIEGQKDFDESKHPRDENGRWTDGGGGDGADEYPLEPPAFMAFGRGVSDSFMTSVNFALSSISPKLIAESGVREFRAFSNHRATQNMDVSSLTQAFYTPVSNAVSVIQRTMGDLGPKEQANTIRHELMHGVDFIQAITMSTSDSYAKAFKADRRSMTKMQKMFYSTFLTPAEAFAEIGAHLTGDSKAKGITVVFPRTTKIVEGHLKRLGILK